MAHDEDIYKVFFGKYKVCVIIILIYVCQCDSLKQSNIQDELKTVEAENMELIKTSCNSKVF